MKYIVVFIILVLDILFCCTIHNWTKQKTNTVKRLQVLNKVKTYHRIHYIQQIVSLQNNNRNLRYVVVEKEKKIKELKSLPPVEVIKEVVNEKVIVKRDTVTNMYSYSGNPTPELSYSLDIYSTTKPKKYNLSLQQFKENKKVQTISITNNIETQKDQEIKISGSVPVYKEKKHSRISIGPTIVYSYDVANKKFGPTIGIGVTYNILK